MIGTPIAAMLASSHFMYVANTGAAVLRGVPGIAAWLRLPRLPVATALAAFAT